MSKWNPANRGTPGPRRVEARTGIFHRPKPRQNCCRAMIFKTVYRSDPVSCTLRLVPDWSTSTCRISANATSTFRVCQSQRKQAGRSSATRRSWSSSTKLRGQTGMGPQSCNAIVRVRRNTPYVIQTCKHPFQSTPIKTKTPGTHEGTPDWPMGLDRSSFEGSPWNFISADWPASSNSKPGAHLPGWGLKASRGHRKPYMQPVAENLEKNNKDCWNGAALFLNLKNALFLKSEAILKECKDL